MRQARTGKVRRVGWNMDQVLLDGRQIATINRVPGSAIGLFAGVLLSPSEKAAVEDAIAEKRQGKKPAFIGTPVELPYEILDDEDEVETDLDEAGDE